MSFSHIPNMIGLKLNNITSQTENDFLFYKNIIDELPAIIYVNEITQNGDPYSLRCKWSNKYAHKFIGYSQKDIDEMGFNFFEKTLHPDDLELIIKSSNMHFAHSGIQFFICRMKCKGNNEYKWLFGNGLTIELYDNGYPKKSLSIMLETNHFMYFNNHLQESLKEINRLKHELLLKTISKREMVVLSMIAKGHTDKHISNTLCISIATAKTHRNRLIRKLGLNNTASLVAFAVECGI
jgi:DNA-binding CsgD family transcriptional regulator